MYMKKNWLPVRFFPNNYTPFQTYESFEKYGICLWNILLLKNGNSENQPSLTSVSIVLELVLQRKNH